MTALALTRYELPLEDPTTISFDAYATWYDTHVIAKRRGKERDRATLTHLRAFFKTDDLLTLTRARAQEYSTHRLSQVVPRTTRHVKPRTVNREVALLKEMLRDAVPRYLKVSPLAGMKALRVVKPVTRILSQAEESRLLAQLAPLDQAFYIVAVDTLIRLGNVLNLRREECRGSVLMLTDSKTGPYTVPLSPRAKAALASLPKKGPYVFPHRRTAKNPRDWRGAVRLMLKRACARCTPPVPYGRAVAGITFHTGTRATGATRMLQAGADLRTVQGVGNWKDIRSVQDYLHTDEPHKQAAVALIGQGVITPAAKKRSRRRSA
jgi:integrase